VSIRTLPRLEPKPSVVQSSFPSRSTWARWVEKIQADSEMSWVLT
jgi:hypothetical protein